MNDFLRRHARKSHLQEGAKTFLAIDDRDGKTILGFYSVSPASIAYERTPELITRGLARHEVPVFRHTAFIPKINLKGAPKTGTP
ncbi:MAG: hypothetical protein AAGU21_19330 [Solidesulfovibrio sp.]|uniref:hypothetical protein n=1 Tax=Solidesulfovibrio sp. TaxID=2910990 RepID=UPI002B1FDA94|nr:hypothetical protein [Solidesulfovibrio sp.]MEA4855388.1 hypothetical protein [Solidesulfovibrio sp.]